MPIIDMAAMKQKFEASRSAGYPVYKPKYGTGKDNVIENKVKLFSWPPEGGQLGKRVFRHNALGGDGKKTAYCLKTFGPNNFCPICDFVERASKSNDPVMVARAEKIAQKERYNMFVADLDVLDKDKKKFVGVYDSSPGFYRRCVQEMASEDYDFTAWESLPVKIICYRRGQNLPSSVEFGTGMRAITLDKDEWLPLIPKIDVVLRAPTPETLTMLLEGRELDDDAAITSGDEDHVPMEHPTPAKTAPAPKPDPTPAPAETQSAPVEKPAAEEPKPKPKMSLNDLLKGKK